MSVKVLENVETVPEYIKSLTRSIISEQGAIEEYDVFLDDPCLPNELKSAIEEIRNDEKDHLVLLSALIAQYAVNSFPDNTSEISEFIESKNMSYSTDFIKRQIDKNNNFSAELFGDEAVDITNYLKNRKDFVTELGTKGFITFVNGKKEVSISKNRIIIKGR